MQQIIGIIPARFASTRFPGKPLVDIGGKPMIQRVYEQCLRSRLLTAVVVATDDERIAQVVLNFGGQVKITGVDHQSGTDRIAEVARQFPEDALLVNIQGDEPFIDPDTIDRLLRLMLDSGAEIGTAAVPIREQERIFDPNTVKVVFNKQQSALYFSRSPIPYQRNVTRLDWLSRGEFFQHLGLYAFRQKTLQEISRARSVPLEEQEALEQLRWLYLGYDIKVVLVQEAAIGIDTPEDLQKINPSMYE